MNGDNHTNNTAAKIAELQKANADLQAQLKSETDARQTAEKANADLQARLASESGKATVKVPERSEAVKKRMAERSAAWKKANAALIRLAAESAKAKR